MGILNTSQIKWGENDLIPAILQDYLSGQVLMLGYMNKEALEKTLQTGEAVFWSRSRQELWHKGQTSGNTQKVISLSLDCDNDTLLVKVQPMGPTCHLGQKSCFGEESNLIIQQLCTTIEERFQNRPEKSYTTYLFNQGLDKILKKVGEEASEVIIAAKNEDKQELAQEAADLIYHLLVLFREKDIEVKEILEVLAERRK